MFNRRGVLAEPWPWVRRHTLFLGNRGEPSGPGPRGPDPGSPPVPEAVGGSLRSSPRILLFYPLLLLIVGCKPAVDYLAQIKQGGDPDQGITYYLGGAGPVGNVGSWDVPDGLAKGGYEGAVEVFPWQSMIHAADQINLERNREKGIELTRRIQEYRRRHPRNDVNIIALSAGTGVATFALEYLPEGANINKVVYLGCSMSSRYDLTRALKRVSGGMYVICSPYDRILRNVVWYTGTVDRRSASEGVAGLEGFLSPPKPGPDTEVQYVKLYNVEYREEFSLTGYEGGHTDSTSKEFVSHYLAGVLKGDDRRLLGPKYAFVRRYRPSPWTAGPTSRPASAPPRPIIREED